MKNAQRWIPKPQFWYPPLRFGSQHRGCPDTYPEGLARHLDASRQKLTPHCLAAIFDSQLPSPKLSLKMPPKLPLPHKRGLFFFFQNCPRGEGNCAAIERQKLSRGNFCLAASRCLSRPSGYFSWFSGYAHLTWFFCRGTKMFGYFPEVPVPGLSLGRSGEKPRTKPGFLLILHSGGPANPGLSLGQTRGRRAAQKVYMKKVYAPFSLAKCCLRVTPKFRG